MSRKIPTDGYILPEWGIEDAKRATAVAYLDRNMSIFFTVLNHDGNRYSHFELKEALLGPKKQTYRFTITLDVTTDKPLNRVMDAIQYRIIRGLDRGPVYTATVEEITFHHVIER